MRVLVATGWMQGERADDFHWCIEGELVQIGRVCGADRGDPGGPCGCGRAFTGLNSHRATTTARVAQVGLTRADYVEAMLSSMEAQGWNPCPCCVEEEADEMLAVVDGWPDGTVVERWADELVVRFLPESIS